MPFGGRHFIFMRYAETYIYIYRQRSHSFPAKILKGLFLNEIMPSAAIWVDLEIIILGEVRQRHIA